MIFPSHLRPSIHFYTVQWKRQDWNKEGRCALVYFCIVMTFFWGFFKCSEVASDGLWSAIKVPKVNPMSLDLLLFFEHRLWDLKSFVMNSHSMGLKKVVPALNVLASSFSMFLCLHSPYSNIPPLEASRGLYFSNLCLSVLSWSSTCLTLPIPATSKCTHPCWSMI